MAVLVPQRRQLVRRKQDDGQLGDFRRLEGKSPCPEPAPGAVYDDAGKQNGYEQYGCKEEKADGPFLPHMIVLFVDKYGRSQPQSQIHTLTDEMSVSTAPFCHILNEGRTEYIGRADDNQQRKSNEEHPEIASHLLSVRTHQPSPPPDGWRHNGKSAALWR